jgi:hypothetical protein
VLTSLSSWRCPIDRSGCCPSTWPTRLPATHTLARRRPRSRPRS